MTTTTLMKLTGLSGALSSAWTTLVFPDADNEAVLTADISGAGTVQVWGRQGIGAPEVLLATLTTADPLEVIPAMAQMQVRVSGASASAIHVTVDAMNAPQPAAFFDLEVPFIPPVITADRLAFLGLASSVASGAVLPAFSVRAVDAFGQVDSSYEDVITLTEETDIAGLLDTQRVVTLRASAPGLLPAISGPITVTV